MKSFLLYRHMLHVLSVFLSTSLFSFSQVRESQGLFLQNWTDTSRLTLLQARMGSRFSHSLSLQHGAFRQGSLGMDNDDFANWTVGISGEKGRVQFRTAPLQGNSRFFPAQTVGFSCLETRLSGSDDQWEMDWSMLSPWKKFQTLADTQALYGSIAPYYQWEITVRNGAEARRSTVVEVSLNQIPVDPDKGVNLSWWRLGKPCTRLYFRDGSGRTHGALALSTPLSQPGILREESGRYGLHFPVDLGPGETKTFTLVFAAHTPEPVLQDEKHNQPLPFLYTARFSNVDAVSDYALRHLARTRDWVAEFEKTFQAMRGSPEEKWLAALAFRTDLANGLLVRNAAGTPFWFETEGRFRHMNTLDVAFETQVLAAWMPWRLKRMLEQWAGYLAVFEEWVPSSRSRAGIRENLEGVSASELGPFVYHDVGNFPYVMKAEGYDFGPYLPVEENAIFVQLVYHYWKTTGDGEFVRKYAGLVALLLQSLQNRDANGNGLADTGHGWSTYDVSEAIKRAPDNTYAGVKMAVAYLLGAELLLASVVTPVRSIDQSLKTTDEDGTTLNGTQKAEWEKGTIGNRYLRERQAREFETEAGRITKTLEKARSKYGYIPVSLDEKFPGWNQRISVLPEGLLYAGLHKARHPELIRLQALLVKEWTVSLEACRKPYGILVSASEPVTWFSKTMVADYVARTCLGQTASQAVYAWRWNRNNDQAYQDGATSLTEAWPGNWYPRGMSAWLYLMD